MARKWRCVYCGAKCSVGALACSPHSQLVAIDPKYGATPKAA